MTGQNGSKVRVAMMVWNTCENDSRVIKEATTLVSAGPLLTGTNPSIMGSTGLTPSPASFRHLCAWEIGSFVTGVTVTGQQGVVSFHPDTG